MDYRFKTITVEGTQYKLKIFDTAGQERFRTITASFYRGTDGILLIFDLTDINSYNGLEAWVSFFPIRFQKKKILILMIYIYLFIKGKRNSRIFSTHSGNYDCRKQSRYGTLQRNRYRNCKKFCGKNF